MTCVVLAIPLPTAQHYILFSLVTMPGSLTGSSTSPSDVQQKDTFVSWVEEMIQNFESGVNTPKQFFARMISIMLVRIIL